MEEEHGGHGESPNVALAFGLNIIAGLCTGIGAVIVALKYNIPPAVTGGVLALSAGVMVYVSFVDIYMGKSIDAFEAYFESVGEVAASDRAFQVSMACFFGGILFTMILDFIVHSLYYRCGKRSKPCCTVETTKHLSAEVNGHEAEAKEVVGKSTTGHAAESVICINNENNMNLATSLYSGGGNGGASCDVPQERNTADIPPNSNPATSKKEVDNVRLIKSGIITALAIALHNFPEGLATFLAALSDPKLGAALATAIAIHNIPEGMAVSLPVFEATKSRWKAILLGTASGLTEPLGGLVGYLVIMETGMSDLSYAILFGMVAGMMVYISVEELLPLALRYDIGNKYATKAFYLGMAIMALSLVLFTL